MRSIQTIGLVVVAVLSMSCAPAFLPTPSVQRPYERQTPSDQEAVDAYVVAGWECAEVRALTAAVDFRGSVAGKRVQGRFWAGISDAGLVRVESSASKTPLFIVSAAKDGATLVLPQDGRTLGGQNTPDVLEAILGYALDVSDLRLLLTGCPRASGGLGGWAFGNGWGRVLIDSEEESFVQRFGPGAQDWRLRVAIRRVPNRSFRWRVEFHDRESSVPRRVRLTSVEWNGELGQSFDLRMSLSRVQINPILEPDWFRAAFPSSAPITLEEVRQMRSFPYGR